MERFSKAAFEKAAGGRNALCEDLANELAARLKKVNAFHEEVYVLIAELQAIGHDLTSYDESDDMQTWGPDYVRASGPGLVITFMAPNGVEVEWSKQ